MTRDDAIKAIRAGLRRRSGKPWSVKGGRGTAWGWITISAPPRRLGCAESCRMDPTDCRDCGRHFNDRPHPMHVCPKHACDDHCSGGYITPEDRVSLASLLGKDSVHMQGESIPSGGDYYAEYVDRAEGRAPSVRGTPYWD